MSSNRFEAKLHSRFDCKEESHDRVLIGGGDAEAMKEEREVGRKTGGINTAATATCNNRAFINSRSWTLWMHCFRDGIIDRQVASAR
jgi:hypothetical protein